MNKTSALKEIISEGLRKNLIRFSDDQSTITYLCQDISRNYNNPEEKIQAETFCELVSTWIGGTYPFEQLISDFQLVLPIVDAMCRGPDYMTKLIPIALLLVDMLHDDPHPSVRQSAEELKTFVNRQSGFRQRMRVSGNLSAPSLGDFAVQPPTGSFPKQELAVFTEFEPEPEQEHELYVCLLQRACNAGLLELGHLQGHQHGEYVCLLLVSLCT